MMRTQVLDPAGCVRGTVEGPATPRQLLAIAWSLGPADRLMMAGDGAAGWALMVFRPGQAVKVAPLGPRAGALGREARAVSEAALLDEAWADLADEGWRAVAVPE